MQDREHGNAVFGKFGQIAKQTSAFRKVFNLVIDQIAAGAFNQVHKRQLLFQRDFLRPYQAISAAHRQRPGFDAAIVRDNHTAGTFDVANTGHMVAGDDNDAFTAAVVDFLDSNVSAQ